jgi:hypothetical protein
VCVQSARRFGVGRIENILRTLEDISAVIERDRTHGICDRYTSFDVYDRERISAERDRERIEKDLVAILVAKETLRYDDHAGARLFEVETTDAVSTAGEEAFADRETSI